jgi:putative PIN family toxin of toxin-antitoxin system
MMMRAVLDANVFVSAVLSPNGIPAALLTAWRAEQFDLLISAAILNEISRVLRYPSIAKRHQWTAAKLQVFLEDLVSLAMMTPGKLTLNVITEDPADNRYLECAVEGDVDSIVSGDRHLLDLREYQGIPILTPRVFHDILRAQQAP